MKLREYRFNYVNLGLPHQYGISAAEEQVSFLRNLPSGEETTVFASYVWVNYKNIPIISPLFKMLQTQSHTTSLSPMHPRSDAGGKEKLVLQLAI